MEISERNLSIQLIYANENVFKKEEAEPGLSSVKHSLPYLILSSNGLRALIVFDSQKYFRNG
jgi:hypothetical protein